MLIDIGTEGLPLLVDPTQVNSIALMEDGIRVSVGKQHFMITLYGNESVEHAKAIHSKVKEACKDKGDDDD